MAVSCETAITDYTYPDASSTESAGSEKKVSKNMKVQVSEEIAEMLLQSHTGEIQFLPALPKAWKSGFITGLRGRDGNVYNIQWKNGKLV